MLNKRIEKLEENFLSDAAKLDALVMARILFQEALERHGYTEVVAEFEKRCPDIPVKLITMEAAGKLKTAEAEVRAQMERGAAAVTDEEMIREIARRLIEKKWKPQEFIPKTIERYPHIEPAKIKKLVASVLNESSGTDFGTN